MVVFGADLKSMSQYPEKWLQRALQGALVLASVGCGASGDYIWVDQVPANSFTNRDTAVGVIAPGDIVHVAVYSQEALSVRTRVREDGKIAMPLVGDVDVAGRTASDVGKDLKVRLKDYVNNPSVSVTVDEVAPLQVAVVGEVTRPGIVGLESRAGVLQAIAQAGGPTEYASRARVFVLRRQEGTNAVSRIRFSYESLSRGEGAGPRFALQRGDVIVFE